MACARLIGSLDFFLMYLMYLPMTRQTLVFPTIPNMVILVIRRLIYSARSALSAIQWRLGLRHVLLSSIDDWQGKHSSFANFMPNYQLVCSEISLYLLRSFLSLFPHLIAISCLQYQHLPRGLSLTSSMLCS